ncbi:AfsR/SARP family transcriptional regulator [Nonomuraea sp. SYSU D8015]|uniref:AfsR/SARP family transcriptional regulator n=1 Tax=Nonomuraea sp. SYSU D8015 TaxID=2593644 RepID=UPI0016606898|nr:AfsR/SARP family transcriptional regulator [Nonomuraea sp. SYSU D8015]
MKFHLLGQMTVIADDGSVPLPSMRQRILLALLISRPGHAVSAETLADALWQEPLGPRSRKNLQVLVHRLRRALGDPARIRHDHSGYMLAARADEVDVWHFAELAGRGGRALRGGDAVGAAALLDEALALWRGPAFAGLDEAAPLAEAAARLDQDRRRAVSDRADAGFAMGEHADQIPALTALLAEDPLAEATAARLMLALYRSGQRPEALDIYRRTRTLLARELGLEPGPQLRALESAMLRGEPDVALTAPRASSPYGGLHVGGFPSAAARREAGAATGGTARPARPRPEPVPHLLPAVVGDLTGRDRELAEILAVLRSQPVLAPVICGISGMPGVGKTALAVRAAHEARDDFPDGRLYVNLRGAGPRPVDPRDALARFLRALGMPGTAIPDTTDERAEMFRARLSDRRVLVILDDAADEAQAEQLIPAGAGCAAIVTSRAGLTALPGAHRLALGVLGTDAAVRLLNTITGRDGLDAEGTTAARLAELCGHLPLALRIAGARLAARPHWPADRLLSRLAAEHDRLNELTHGSLSVRASLALGYSGLAEPVRALFRRLGLVEAPDFAGWVAAALLGTGSREAEDVLERLLDAQLVEYAGVDHVGEARYRMHDLVRLHARERGAADEPPGAAEAALTRLTGAYLALAEQAHRRRYGGDYTVLHGSGPRWDVGEATSQRLLADPMAWLRSERLGLVTAVEQAARLGLSETCWDLAMTAVTLFEAQGLFDDWRRTSETALAAAIGAGDVRGEAAMRHSLGTLAIFRQRHGEARPHFEAALPLFESMGDRHGQALTLRNAALIERVEGRADAALGRYERALAMLREVGDRHAEAHVLGSIAQIHIEHDRPGRAAPLLETGLAVYRELGDERGAAQILNRMGALYLGEGRATQAEAVYRQVTTASLKAGDRIGQAHGLLGTGEARLLAGDLDGAEGLLDAALALATEVGEPFVAARARLAAGRHAVERHDLESAHALLREAARGFSEIGMSVWHGRALQALHALDAEPTPPPQPL